MTILFDRLRYLDKLTSAGIPEAQARAHAEAVNEALRQSVATKSDLKHFPADLNRGDSQGVRNERVFAH